MIANRLSTLRTNLTALFIAGAAALFLSGGGAVASPENDDCVTIVPGGPVVGQTWTAANSPYCVTGDLFISHLTIEPGVTVLIDGPWRLNIQTIIKAEGTEKDPIIFTAKDPGVSKWKGMLFDATMPGSVLRHCVFSHANDSAIRIIDAAPTIDLCVFVNNTAPFRGGAIYAELPSMTLGLSQCQFEGNRANPTSANGSAFGGAVYIDGSVAIIECVFEQNSAFAHANQGQDRVAGGGGIAVFNGHTTIIGSVFHKNHAQAIGGGMFPGARRARGAGVYVSGSATVEFSNVMIGGNTLSGPTEESGGGIYIQSGAGEITLTNVTIARNHRAGLHRAGGNVTVRNSIFWQNNNSGTQIIGDACVYYSTVHNGFGGDCGDNNITFNPAFAGDGTTHCDLRILAFSPAIDAGDPDPIYNDSDACFGPPYGSERNDMGAHGGPGACWRVPGIVGDLNCDDCVDHSDLAGFLAAWGSQPGDPNWNPYADLTGDGVIGHADLALLLSNWGEGC